MIAEVLEIVNKLVGNKFNNQYGYAILRATEEHVQIEARNLTGGVRVHFDKHYLDGGIDVGEYTVDIEKLARLYRLMPEGTLISRNNNIIFLHGKSKVLFSAMSESPFTSFFTKYQPTKGYTLDYPKYRPILKDASRYCIVNNGNNPTIFENVCLADHNIITTDKAILSVYDLEDKLPDVILPALFVNYLTMLSAVKEFTIHEPFGSRILCEVYPSKVPCKMEFIFTTMTQAFPTTLNAMVENAEIPIKIQVPSHQLKEVLKVLNVVESKSNILIEGDGNLLQFTLSSDVNFADLYVPYEGGIVQPISFLQTTLDKIIPSLTEDFVEIGIKDSRSATIWQTSVDHKLLVMPSLYT